MQAFGHRRRPRNRGERLGVGLGSAGGAPDRRRCGGERGRSCCSFAGYRVQRFPPADVLACRRGRDLAPVSAGVVDHSVSWIQRSHRRSRDPGGRPDHRESVAASPSPGFVGQPRSLRSIEVRLGRAPLHAHSVRRGTASVYRPRLLVRGSSDGDLRAGPTVPPGVPRRSEPPTGGAAGDYSPERWHAPACAPAVTSDISVARSIGR